MDAKIIDLDKSLGAITVSGELGGVNLSAFQEASDHLLNQDLKNIIMNFIDVHFISSMGFGVIVGVGQDLKERGGFLSIVCKTPRLLDEFKQMHLDQIVRVFHSWDEAVASYEM